jgi:hypothetical protein
MNSIFPRPSSRRAAILVLIVLVCGLAGCAGEVKGLFKTKLGHEKVLISAADALRAIGFSAKEQDGVTGVLLAEKYAMVRWNGPALVHINIKVQEIASGTELRVQVVPPSGTYGSARIPFDDLAYSLHNQIEDITMVSVEGE